MSHPLKVFIGCPGDMSPERAALLSLRDHFDELGCPVRFLTWKNATSGAGDPQKVIFDNYPVKEWDIFIGLLWTRFGVPSGIFDALSGETLTGTESEFAGAYDAFLSSGGTRPQILLYRCKRALPNDVDLEQIAGVRKFFKQTETGGQRPALTQDFETSEELSRLVVQDIVKLAERIRKPLREFDIAGGEVGTAVEETPDWIEAEEHYRRHLIDSNRIVKFYAAEASRPVEVELEKVFIKLMVSPRSEAVLAITNESFGQALDELGGRGRQLLSDSIHGSGKNQDLFSTLLIDKIEEIHAGGRLRQLEEPPTSFSDILRQYTHLALAGTPGCGKSTLLQYLVLTFASRQQQTRLQLNEERLPIVIRLRNFIRWVDGQRQDKKLGEVKPAHFCEFLAHQWADEKGAPKLPPGFFQRLLYDNRALILLDGLDEVAEPVQRRAIAGLVATALDDWREARVILTSRPKAWESEGRAAIGSRVGEARICELDDPQIEEFIHQWYLAATLAARGDTHSARSHAERRAVDLIAALKPERIRKLASSPLMLSILAMVHSRGAGLPQERSLLYHECIEFMLGYWDELTGFSPDIELQEVAARDRQTKRQILEPVALWMHRLGSEQIEPLHDDLVKQFAEGFAGVLNEPRPAAERHSRTFLRLIVERGGLMQESDAGQFRFVHLTFQEYIAASAIAHGEAPFTQVEPHLHDPWWREVILLAGGELSQQKSFRTRSETRLWLEGIRDAGTWAERHLRRDLSLAVQACADMTETGVDPRVTEDLARRLIDSVMEYWAREPVVNLSKTVQQLPVGHFTRAIEAVLPRMTTQGKSRLEIPALMISRLLPGSVTNPSLIEKFVEASSFEDANSSWTGVLLALKHGSPDEGRVAVAQFQTGAASGGWPISAKQTSELFSLGNHELGEVALAFGRRLVSEEPTNQSVDWASLLVKHGTPEDRRMVMDQLIADLDGKDSDRTGRALHELFQLAEYSDTPEVRAILKRILSKLGRPRVSTPAHSLQIGAVKLWTELTNRDGTVDCAPLLPIVIGPWDEYLEKAFLLVLKYGSDVQRKRVRKNLISQMKAGPPGESSAILIFLIRNDPEADFDCLISWAEGLASRKEPHGAWRVWDVLSFFGEKAWSCPLSIQRLVEEAQAKDTM